MFETMSLFITFFQRLVWRRWRLFLVISVLSVIPVLLFQWMMLKEQATLGSSWRDLWGGRQQDGLMDRLLENSQDSRFRDRFNDSMLDDMNVTHPGRGRRRRRGRGPSLYWGDFLDNKTGDFLVDSRRFCNRKLPRGEESDKGLGDGWELLSVNVVVRHGARSPLVTGVSGFEIALNCSLTPLDVHDDNELNEFLQRLRSTASRDQPGFTRFNAYPNFKSCPVGSLTDLGVLQHLVLGRRLAQAYPSLFQRMTHGYLDVIATSTVVERTYHTAQAFLTAFFLGESAKSQSQLFGGLQIQPSKSLAFCNESYVSKCSCPKLRLYHGEMAQSKYRLLHSKKLISRVKADFANFFGITEQRPLNHLVDLVVGAMCSKSNSLSDPGVCWKTDSGELKCAPKDLIETLWKADELIRHNENQDESYRFYCKLTMYPFLKELNDRMVKMSQQSRNSNDHDDQKNTNEPVFLFHSGHDTTLRFLIRALDLQISEWPPFASRFVVELYSLISSSSDDVSPNDRDRPQHSYRFRVLYNGQDLTRQFPGCVSFLQSDLEKGCPLDLFHGYLTTDYWSGFASRDYNKECHGV